jgi:hypothetical protein
MYGVKFLVDSMEAANYLSATWSNSKYRENIEYQNTISSPFFALLECTALLPRMCQTKVLLRLVVKAVLALPLMALAAA